MFASGDADWAVAFDQATGDEVWRYRIGETYAGHDGSHDGPISTPLLDGGRVFGLGAHGQLFALDAATGEERWAIHVADDLGGVPPFYGFGTSPILAEGTLVVEIGAGEGKAIAGLDPDTGALRWSLGNEEINYQSPIVATIGGRSQVVAGDAKVLYGIDASDGTVLWSHEHQGDERAMGGATIIPVPSGDGRLLIMNKIDSSTMLQVARDGDGWSVSELWTNNSIKQSYVVPVYHDGYLYGMNNRILVCVDAATGELAWRSREPGDGFPTIVGDLLVIATKPGTLHVADASPEGYRELASIELFGEHTWSTVAYAGGSLFARSMAKVARIDATTGGASGTAHEMPAWVASGAFGKFLAGLETAADKGAAIDEFLGAQASIPIVEDSGAVHFVYRGEAEDVGIVGDMIGSRREDPMTRVPGTDLFVYSTMLEPTAAVTYGFIPAFGEEAVADPLNPDPGDGLFGEVSFVAMPAWEGPAFFGEADPPRRGALETFEWESAVKEGAKRTAQVYLPAGFDPTSDRRYPVVYVNDGKAG
jgi:outer membrane protein assembly factor BamB